MIDFPCSEYCVLSLSVRSWLLLLVFTVSVSPEMLSTVPTTDLACARLLFPDVPIEPMLEEPLVADDPCESGASVP